MAKQRSRVVVGVVVAVVVLAGVAATILVLSRGGSVTLPDELEGYDARDSDAAVPDSVSDRDEVLDGLRRAREYSAQQYTDAFDGADADVRAYLKPDDVDAGQYTVVAIEADAGPLLPEFAFDDPQLSRLAAPLTERVEEGEAECLLRRSSPPPANSDPDEEDLAPVTVTCQRTSNALTVRVTAGTDPTVEDTVEFLDAAWAELH